MTSAPRLASWQRLKAWVLKCMIMVCTLLISACASSVDHKADQGASRLDDRVAFAVLPSIVRMTPAIDLAREDVAPSVMLDLARGEREGAQAVVWAESGKPRIALKTSKLKSATGDIIAAKNVRVFIEHPMVVKQGSPAGRSGTYVDPLIPAARRDVVITKTNRLLIWIDIEAPRQATPGLYKGEVVIHRSNRHGVGSGDPLAKIPVEIKVQDVRLPERPMLESSVGLDQSQLSRFESEAAEGEGLRDVTESYVSELANARLSAADLGVIFPGTLPGHQGLAGDELYLKRVINRPGVASVRIPMYLTHPFADPLGRDRKAAVLYLRKAAAWARRNGWIDRAYVFVFDEPDDADAGAVREMYELLKEADPQLRHLVVREASARVFQGSVDIWAPNINPRRYKRADVIREKRAGNSTWWYPSITSWQPWPTLFIDDLRPAPRALGWLAWREGIDGFLYWSSTHWHEVQDPLNDPGTYNETNIVGNGDGVLLYPGGFLGLASTPIPSVRLFQLRDGLEDYDLLSLAACASNRRALLRLRKVAHDVAPAMDSVDPSFSQVKAMRDTIFDIMKHSSSRSGCAS